MPRIHDVKEVNKLGSILGVWAHPDDESFMTAGLMAQAVRNGQSVACVTATKGEKGTQDEKKWPTNTLGVVRAKELEKAYAIMGVKHHHWLDYPDGGCHMVNDDEVVKRIGDLIELYKADTIITFPPDGLTGHPDHAAASRWARLAVKNLSRPIRLLYAVDTNEKYEDYLRAIDDKFDVYFNISKPCFVPEAECDLLIELNTDLCKLKCLVLAAMPSQTTVMFATFGREYMESALGTEAFVDASRPIKWGIPKKLK